MEIGRRIYYDIETGNVIQNVRERTGSVVVTTVEQDFAAYSSLNERIPSTVGNIQLEYGQYDEDFATCNGYRIDPITEQILFSYPDPNEPEPEEPPVFVTPLSVQVAELQDENAFIAMELADTQMRLDQSEQSQADLILLLVTEGVL